MKKKVKLVRRVDPLPTDAKRALVLRPSVSLGAAYVREWEALVTRMHEETVKAVLSEFGNTAKAEDAIGDFWDRLATRLAAMFTKSAQGIASGMMQRVDRNATTNLERSLKDASADLTLTMKNTPAVNKAINSKIKENVYLIKRIPEEYLDSVKDSVRDSIKKGNGLDDLTEVMEERYGEAKRHARNVALDQTRKAYTAINTERMKANGVNKFEWVHTGGSQEPRKYHLDTVSEGGLNGGVFDINNPPIIDKKTGRRGLPGDDYYCRCTMRPIVTFDDDDEDSDDGGN